MPVTDAAADAVVRLGHLALDFGRINRITRHPDGTTPESDTDHTVMLGLTACAIAHRWFPELHQGLVAQFALVHDLVETYAGDTPTLRELDTDSRTAKKAREDAAATRIRVEFGDEFPWPPLMITAYEAGTAPEARFVRMLDKLLPKITHLLNGAATITADGMTREQLAARYAAQGRELARFAAEFPEIEELRRMLVDRVLDQIDRQQADDGPAATSSSIPRDTVAALLHRLSDRIQWYRQVWAPPDTAADRAPRGRAPHESMSRWQEIGQLAATLGQAATTLQDLAHGETRRITLKGIKQ